MNPDELRARLQRLFADVFELDPAQLSPQARLREDLDLDSLDGVDLVVAIEKTFGVRVEEDVIPQMKTVGDVERELAQLTAAAPER